jgi:digeranylgeranylglycerophospholipid reductase
VDLKADVIIVGGGPCGSFSAFKMAKLNVKVLVCEEHSEIGAPSHCAGHISLQGLKQLGLHLPKEVIENEIRGAIFYSPSGFEFKVQFAAPVTYVLNRTLFDRFLAELAEKAGAEYRLGTRVDSLLADSGRVSGVLTNNEALKSKLVIDCEGCSSLLLKKARLPTLDRTLVVQGVEAEVDKIDNVEKKTVEVYVGEKYAPGFYAWIIPRPDGSAKIGLATNRGNPKACLKRLISHHPKAKSKLGDSEIVRISYHPITLGGPLTPSYHDGLLIVGDAASQVKPTTGGGIIMGLNCARIASETAYEAIKQDDTPATFLSIYQKRWQEMIGFDMAVMRRMRLLLNRLSDRQLDKIIAMSSQLGLDKSLTQVGDIDFQGRGMRPLFRSPAAWTIAMYTIISSLVYPF